MKPNVFPINRYQLVGLLVAMLCYNIASSQIDYGTPQLYNSLTDQPILNLSDGTTYDLNVVGDSLNVIAVPPGGVTVESVRFLTSVNENRTESFPPYAFEGDSSGDFFSWLTLPNYLDTPITFTIEYWSENGAAGVLLGDDIFTITFTKPSPDTTPPSVPTGLTSTGNTETTVMLSWNAATDNVGVTGYKIFKDGSLEATLGNVLSYEVTGLTAATLYQFTVSALDAASNESAASNSINVSTASGSGGGGNLTEITVIAATASGYSDTFVPANLIDDNLSSRWGMQGAGEWANLDLGTPQDFDQIAIAFLHGDQRTANFDLLVSNDAATWTPVLTNVTSSGTTTDLETFTFPVQNARYLRYLGFGNSVNNWNSINEIKVYTSGGSHNNGNGEGASVWTENNTTASYSGEVAIGRSTVPSGYKLAVDGQVRAREIRVDQDSWPDYVFAKDYPLPSPDALRKYILEKGHLPNIPSATEVKANGIELGEMNRLLLEKIEELTLYMLEQEQRIKSLEQTNTPQH